MADLVVLIEMCCADTVYAYLGADGGVQCWHYIPVAVCMLTFKYLLICGSLV
jgi:hypothetical protein